MTMLAVNHLTPVVGIDVHMVIVPPAPSPIPLPHPHVGVVLDLREYVNAAMAAIGSIVFSFVEEQAEAFVQAHEQQIEQVMHSEFVQSGMGAVNAVMNNDAVQAGMSAMNKLGALQNTVNDALGGNVGQGGGGAPIYINGMLRATAGTHTFHVPGLHFPLGASFAATDAKGPSQDSESFMGSRTVLANGDPMSFLALPALSCWCAGMLPMSHNSAHTDRKYMSLPTSVMLPIPAERPVLVGGPPVMNMMAVAAALFKAFRGSKLAKKLFAKFPSGFIKCVIFDAEPVNSITGEVVVQQNDFTVEGRLPLVWDRYYASHDDFAGALGHGWRSPADIRLELVREREQFGAAVYFADHATAFDDLPAQPGWTERVYDRQHGHALFIRDDEIRIRARVGIEYAFALPRQWRERVPSVADGRTFGVPLARLSDLNGNAWHIERRVEPRDGSLSMRFIEHAGDQPTGREVLAGPGSVRGCIGAVVLRDAQGVTHPLATYRQDEQGNLGAVLDAHDVPYSFEYADSHQMVRHTDRNGLSFYYNHTRHDDDVWRVDHAWGDGGLYDYRFEYDLAHLETRFTDSLGHVTVLQYNDQQWPVARIDGLGGVRSYQYDSQGRTIAEVDPSGHIAQWEYDAYGNLLTHRLADRTVVRTEYDADHRPVSIADPEGGEWKQSWDARGNLIAQTTPSGIATAFIYDARGQLRHVTDAAQRTTTLHYDDCGHLSSLSDALGRITRFTHDGRGNLLRRESPGEAPTRYVWDAKDRLVACDLPGGRQVRCEYDREDNLVRYTDEAGQITRFGYYGQGQLQTRTDPDGSITRYHYDTEEQLIGVSNPLGQTWQLRRDAAGRLIEEIDYYGQSRRYAYDAAGHLSRTVDPLGKALAIACDPLGRITRRSADSGAWEEYAYNRRGQLIEARNAHGVVERAYDVDGRITCETQQQDGTLGTVEYVYDAAGELSAQRRELRSSASEAAYRQTLTYGYDALGQVQTLKIGAHEPIRFTHDMAGRLSGLRLSAQLDQLYEYDGAGRLARQTARAAGQRDAQVAYEYDPSGNLVTRSDSRLGVDRYRYDPLGRIVAHTDPAERVRHFVYDAQGDRFRTVREDRDGRELRQADGAHWWLDAAGQLTERQDRELGVQRFEWDEFGRLARFENTSNERWTYRYDALGRRIGKQAAEVRIAGKTHREQGSRTHFLWDGDVMVGEMREAPTCAGQARFYAYHESSFEPLAVQGLERQGDGGAGAQVVETGLFFYENEPNGAPTRLRNEAGEVVWEAHYGVTGGVDHLEARGVEQPIRLQGQYFDRESSLCYNRHRYFDPQTGIFISQDPIGLLGGLNPYEFAPNPFGWIDPNGLVKLTAPGYQVYGLYNIDADGNAVGKPYYIGITNDIDRRTVEHQGTGRLDKDGVKTGLFPFAEDGKMSYGKARGVEQAYIDHYGTYKPSARGKKMSDATRGNRVNSFRKNREDKRGKTFFKNYKAKMKSLKKGCGKG
ncbi:rhsD protein [Caballeronia calidae]|uniref:RhsD protein n=1 Tax=Caballeronia calidae TaxID=1777139 RepID=A0A158D138_9BURK|nr:RHS repeat-associated core domain-containing protein [Caballeronia calidae]SAK88362.1 rhsD protein [Caballeronia calidae]